MTDSIEMNGRGGQCASHPGNGRITVAINASNIRDLPEPRFIKWLVSEPVAIPGVGASCYKLEGAVDEEALREWALHVRRHYVRDDELSGYASVLGVGEGDYLQACMIPDVPQIRSGDFAEIVISDMLQFLRGYRVPRYKHHNRKDKNKSETGSDVVGYRLADARRPSKGDELVVAEVKSGATTTLKDALSRVGADSGKDQFRYAATLDYYLRDCVRSHDSETAAEIRRFMDKGEHDYAVVYAGAVVSGVDDAVSKIGDVDAEESGLSGYDEVIVVHRKGLMSLIHDVYGRCTA